MKTKLYYSLIMMFVVTIIVLSTLLHYKKNQAQEALMLVAFSNITNNIIQLEGAIFFQMEQNWSDPNNVVEKVEDVIEGIHNTIRVGNELKILPTEDEVLLFRFIRYFEKFPEYSGFPNHHLEYTNIERFENLRNNLRAIGWGYNISYSNSWTELIEKADELIRSQYSSLVND